MRAAGVDGDTFAKAVALLRVSHMVQTRGARSADRIEPYHDRVRMAVLTHLDPRRRAEIHRRIAITLEAGQPVDAESLVMHWQGAGGLEQAAHFAVIAGDRAAEALAFDPAASFYEIALTSKAQTPAERRALLIKLAEARSNAGRGEAAAEAFRKAAEGAGVFEALELRRREAEELRAAGDIDAFAAALRQVLAAVGIQAPRTPLATLFWLLVYGVWQLVVGLRFEERTRDQVPPEARARVDALFAAARGLGTVDPILGRYMCKRATIAALRVGDTSQVLRVTALEASNTAAAGGPVGKRERRLMAIARRLADAEGNSEGQTFFRACLGISLHLRGEWNAARENLESAFPSTDSRRAGRQAHVQVFGAWTLMYLGEYREVARRFPRLLADANARGDLYTSVQLRSGYLAVLWLAADDPQTARRHIRESLAQWSRKGFLLQHWHATCGETNIELYEGNGAGAYERWAHDLPAMSKSLLLKCQHVRIGTMFTRGRCAVASASSADVSPQVRRQRLAEARRVVRRLEREVHVCGGIFAALVSAGVSNAEGDQPRAIALLRTAVSRADQTSMTMHAAAARYQLGCLLDDEEGKALKQKGEDAMKAQDVRKPERFARMWLPGRWEP
jgi:tetratricopeptide (TPR) repeat protein